MPRAYMATILSSKPVKRRSCLGISNAAVAVACGRVEQDGRRGDGFERAGTQAHYRRVVVDDADGDRGAAGRLPSAVGGDGGQVVVPCRHFVPAEAVAVAARSIRAAAGGD